MAQKERASSAFFGGVPINDGPVVSRFRHDGKHPTGYSFTSITRNEMGRIVTGLPTPVPLGTEVIVDLGGLRWGAGCFRPYDMSLLVPYGALIPVVPAGKTGEYTDLIALNVYIRGYGLAQWIIGGVLGQNALFALWTAYIRSREAAEGSIPVTTLQPSEPIPIASRNGEISYRPLLEISAWVQRDEAIFGPRTVAPPVLRVEASSAADAPAQSVVMPQPVPMVLPPEQPAQPLQAVPAVQVTDQPPVLHYPPAAATPVTPPAPVAGAADPFASMQRAPAAAPAVPSVQTAPIVSQTTAPAAPVQAAPATPQATAAATPAAPAVAPATPTSTVPPATMSVPAPGAAPPF
jgi:hypothetical protein